MWMHGAFLAAIAGVLLACSDGERYGGQWYRQKSLASSGAAGVGDDSAGASGVEAGGDVDNGGGASSSER